MPNTGPGILTASPGKSEVKSIIYVGKVWKSLYLMKSDYKTSELVHHNLQTMTGFILNLGNNEKTWIIWKT